MKAVIYTRVSTVEQAEMNKSLEMQEKACRDFVAKSLNATVERVFIEEGESAKTADRTQLKELISYCMEHKGEIKYVVVWKLDRLARKTEDHIALVNIFMKLGIRLCSATELLEDTPSGKLMEHILASFAEFDNAVRSERSSKGMQARLQEGGWVHKAPIGYRNIKDSLKRPTVEPDEMAKHVQRFLKDFAKGKILNDSASTLAASKYKIQAKGLTLVNGKRKYSKMYDKPVGQSTVYSMLRNPIYAGFVSGKGLDDMQVGLHFHNALITADEYWQIQSRLRGDNDQPKHTYGENRSRWTLRRFLTCGYCGNTLTGSLSKGRSGGAYEYYHCTHCKGVVRRTGKQKGTYKHLTLARTELHEAFERLIEGLQPSPASLSLFREIVLRKWNADYAETVARRTMAQKNITDLDKQKSEYIDMCRRGAINDIELAEQKDKIAIERTSMEIELSEIEQEFLDVNKVIDMAIDYMANAARMWNIADGDNRLRFQKMVLPNGVSVFADMKFGTTKTGYVFREAHLLDKEVSSSKKTLHEAKSLVVIPRGIEPLLPG